MAEKEEGFALRPKELHVLMALAWEGRPYVVNLCNDLVRLPHTKGCNLSTQSVRLKMLPSYEVNSCRFVPALLMGALHCSLRLPKLILPLLGKE